MFADKYPINTMQCDYDGCESTNTTPCIITDYRASRFAMRQYITWLGVRGAIGHLRRLWRVGWSDFPPEYYCAEHAKENGFCWGCGSFVSGGDVGFDFRGEWLCCNCKGDLEPDCDDRDEWLADWERYPARLLVGDSGFEQEQ